MVIFKDKRNGSSIELNRPTAFFDSENGALFALGEYEDVMETYINHKKIYTTTGYEAIANNLVVMELPNDQKVFDEVLQISGRVLHYYEQFKAK